MTKITREQYAKLNSAIFSVEKTLEEGCEVRHLLYLARTKLTAAINLSQDIEIDETVEDIYND